MDAGTAWAGWQRPLTLLLLTLLTCTTVPITALVGLSSSLTNNTIGYTVTGTVFTSPWGLHGLCCC